MTGRCGTHLGYRDHQAAGEPTCRPCRDAQASWQRQYVKRRYLSGGHLLVDGTGTRRRLQALAVMGWPTSVLWERLGSSRSYTSALRYADRVHQRTAGKVAALYDELSMVRGPSERASQDAQRKGWPAPLAWDDDTIDDPAARPAHNLRGAVTGAPRDEDFDARVMELTRAGLSAPAIALRLRTNERRVQRARARYRTEDVA